MNRKSLLLSLGAFAATAVVWVGANAMADPGPDSDEARSLKAGKELFTREWLLGDRRSFAGDGLGPVFNERSCVACHRQGGIGGAGPRETNATLVSVFVAANLISPLMGIPAEPDTKKQPDRAMLIEIHPALRTGSSFPLHRYGSEKAFLKWQTKVLSNDNFTEDELGEITDLAAHASLLLATNLTSSFRGMQGTRKIDGVTLAFIPSQRNAPALFGAALIDRIPDQVLEDQAQEQSRLAAGRTKKETDPKPESSEGRTLFDNVTQVQGALPITGRVMRLKNGRIGRFGWKANVASLKGFTLQACSNELGLEVPGFPRAVAPWKPNYKAPGLDLSAGQCDQLVRFVASLARPTRRAAETAQHAEEIAAGQKLFSEVGCAACHRPSLGDVDGIYSDLLLHDMGRLLSDSGSYGTDTTVVVSNASSDPLPVQVEAEEKTVKEKPPKFGASTREWRTPPLWGLRDSAPYLHDGRADTVSDAVALHGGEGLLAAQLFFKLTPRERQQVELFLQSLVAPPVK